MNWVVVVDDEEYNRKTVSRMLTKHGFMDYLSKPVNISDTENTLMKYVGGEMKKTEQPPSLDTKKGMPQALSDIFELEYEKGLEYCGDMDDYLFALETYAENVEEKATQLEQCLREEAFIKIYKELGEKILHVVS